MKKKLLMLVFIVTTVSVVMVGAAPLKGMSLNGSTGLVSIPTGRIGWERTADFGFDLGYHAVVEEEVTTHIPKMSISLFKMLELGAAHDTQEESEDSDTIIHGKIQLPIKRATAIAIGGNAQMLKENDVESNYQQLYLAATYPGDFFKMPAETTFVIGKTFGEHAPDDAIDFGMGFDLLLFPEVFQGYIHWINDFSNFSYSVQPIGADSTFRGVFNTGIRIDLASIPEFSKFKFAVDAIITDALDANRAFALGIAFGAAIK
jgi:hypothetical protein